MQRETAYRDSLDQFKLRSGVAPERLQEIEESVIVPLIRHIRRFEQIFAHYAAVQHELSKDSAPEIAPQLRSLFRQSLSASALVKGTTVRKQFASQWAAWEKLEEVDKPLRQYREERQQLLDRRLEFEVKGQPLPEAERKRLEQVEFDISLGSFEQALRRYESEPWKEEKDANRRKRSQTIRFRSLVSSVMTVLATARHERVDQWRQNWPKLPPLRLENADLLTCDQDRAEQIVASLFKKPEAALAGNIKVRKLRTLAETYRMQQRAWELSYGRLEDVLDSLRERAPSREQASQTDTAALTGELLTALRSATRLKRQLLSTWINYQTVRLDLYLDLGLTPP